MHNIRDRLQGLSLGPDRSYLHLIPAQRVRRGTRSFGPIGPALHADKNRMEQGVSNMTKSHHTLRAVLLAGAALATALPALSQELMLEEIVVTARKRAESLQDAAVSVSAFTAEGLQRAGIGDVLEVVNRVPGFTMNADNATEPNIFMRGIGTDIESAASSPAVGFFLDDVYLSRAQGTNLELFDFERIEVVRGPQGTLYGKNVVGGAVNFITKQPTEDQDTVAEVSVGNYSFLQFRGATGGALADNLYGRIAFSARGRDGFAYNTFTKNDVEDLSSMGVKGALRLVASETLEVTASADFSRRRSDGRWIDMVIPSAHNVPFKNPDPRKGPNNTDGRQHSDVGGSSIKAVWSLENGSITSLTGYRDAAFEDKNNDAGSYLDMDKLLRDANGRIQFGKIDRSKFNDDFYINAKTEDVKTFSQEFRYSSDFDGPFNVMAGVFYMGEDIDRNEDADYIFVDYFAQGRETARTTAKGDTWSAFVEGTWDVTDSVTAIGGVRYTKDIKKFTVARAAFGDFLGQDFEDARGRPTTAFTAGDKHTWSAWTPSATLQWKTNDDVMLYATVAKGFKSGGWNGENANNPTEAAVPYDPEFAWNYETGIKSQWLDNRLRLNLTGFVADYKDLQTQQYVIFSSALPPDNVIANAGKARVKGLELELLAVPVEGLTLSGSYALMDGKITGDLISTALRYDPSCFCSKPVPTNLKGNKLRRTPKNSLSAGAQYEFPVNDKVNGLIRADYSWTDGYFFENENSDRTWNPSYGLIDAGIGVVADDGAWEVMLWGKNLSDKLYTAGKTDVIGSVLASYAPPRTYGVTLKVKF